MFYWTILIILFVSLISITLYMLHMFKQKRKCDNIQENLFGEVIMLLVVVLSFLAFLSIDIPSALSGGEEIYVNELPTRIAFSINIVYVDTDDEILKQLKGCDWNKYEKYGNYRIRYTKFNKIVLDIERLD